MDTTTNTRTSRTIVLAALVLLAALVATLLNPGSAQARTLAKPHTASEVSLSWSVATLLNAERATHHLPPVAMRTKLINSARNHNLAMARANTMSHQVSGEIGLGSRISAAGYNWTWAGENIGWNSDMSVAGVLMLEQAMYNELPPNDGHRLNILSSHYTNVGVDVYLDNTNHKVWLTVDFGRP